MTKAPRMPVTLGALAVLGASSCSNTDCTTRLNAYEAAIYAAGQCNLAAAVPCTGYQDLCGPVGVNPDAAAALSATLSEYEAAECSLPVLGCPISVETPPPYACETAGDGGGARCFSSCESLDGTCVSQSMGCGNGSVDAELFCSDATTECCLPSS